MKITLDLPDSLVREVELRAIQEGLELNEMFVELIRRGLEIESDDSTAK